MLANSYRPRRTCEEVVQRRRENGVVHPYMSKFQPWHERVARLRLQLARQPTSSERASIWRQRDELLAEIQGQEMAFRLAAARLAPSGRILDLQRAFASLLEEARSLSPNVDSGEYPLLQKGVP